MCPELQVQVLSQIAVGHQVQALKQRRFESGRLLPPDTKCVPRLQSWLVKLAWRADGLAGGPHPCAVACIDCRSREV